MNRQVDFDKSLTAKIISGNKDAFKAVYTKHWKGIFMIAFSFLKSNGIKLYSAALSEKAKAYTEENYTEATAIAVGTEDVGLTDGWCKQSENHIVIPMLGVNDSLNVSVAAGIILFEALRQRK